MHLRRRKEQAPPAQDPAQEVEAKDALASARACLREAHEQWDEVTRTSTSLRVAHQRNHFAEMIEASMRRRSTNP